MIGCPSRPRRLVDKPGLGQETGPGSTGAPGTAEWAGKLNGLRPESAGNKSNPPTHLSHNLAPTLAPALGHHLNLQTRPDRSHSLHLSS